ncbi:MAG TPA: hypothetical protein VFN29_10675 [Chiayiivirga sp.]|nr:hypothetical protein [Chiayiivirga sp.]
MRRKRLHLSVTLAVLGLGFVVGWIAGERPTVSSNAWAGVATGVENPVTEVLRERQSALRMPYFSFKNILPRPQGEPGA